jgi:hypothetical protein
MIDVLMSYASEIIEFSNFAILQNYFKKIYKLNEFDLKLLDFYFTHWVNSARMCVTPIGQSTLSGKTFFLLIENLFIDCKKLCLFPLGLLGFLMVFAEKMQVQSQQANPDYQKTISEQFYLLFIFTTLNIVIASDISYQLIFTLISLFTRPLVTAAFIYRSNSNSLFQECSDIFQSVEYALAMKDIKPRRID